MVQINEAYGDVTVAEGVETKEQLEFLRDLKCDEVQDYVFSRPLPSDEATELLFLSSALLRKQSNHTTF